MSDEENVIVEGRRDSVVTALPTIDIESDLATITSVGDLRIIRRPSRDAARRSQSRVPFLESAPPASVLPIYRKLTAGLVATDFVSILLALALAHIARYGVRGFSGGYVLGMAVAPVVWVATYGAFGLYAMQGLSAPERIRKTIGATSAGLFLITLVISGVGTSFSGRVLAVVWGLTIALFFGTRALWHRYEGHLTETGRLTQRALIVGTNSEAHALATSLLRTPSGFSPIGYVSTTGPRPWNGSLPVLGTLEQLSQLIRDHRADCVIVAVSAVPSEKFRRIFRMTRQAGVEVKVSAGFPMMLTSRVSVQNLGGTMVFAIRPIRLRRTQALVKRTFDVVTASAMLAVSLPVCAVVALAIRLTSPGPVLFRQERVTKGLRTFTMYKFRTMTVDADRLLEEEDLDISTPFFKLDDGDPRVTPLGRFMRSLSLDELPQLWNVIRGDMSLVGPRPLPVGQVRANLAMLEPRHEVAAGLTGWWQINGRAGVTPEEAVRLDLFYIENWSLPLDLYVLARSFAVVLSGRGAR